LSWDLVCKALVKECAQDFVTYFAPGALFVTMSESQLQTRLDSPFGSREMREDGTLEAEYAGKRLLVGVEWQSDKDDQMGARLLFYGEEHTRLTGKPARMGVIYTQHVSNPPASPLIRRIPCDPLPQGNEAICFHFASLPVCDTPVAELLELHLDAFTALSVLCEDGGTTTHFDRVLERLLQRREQRKIAITAAFFFASKVMTSKEGQAFLRRREDILTDKLEDNWFYQELYGKAIAKSHEKGLEEGHEKGLEEGREEGSEKGIMLLVEARFPNLLALVKEQIASLPDKSKLQDILLLVGTARTEEEVSQGLLDLCQVAS
jgi:hypothetical protein